MKVIKIDYPLLKGDYSPSVAAIGYFDGLHLGHQGVIKRAIDQARERNLLSSVITFDPHPREVLKKGEITSYITPLADKVEILRQIGIDIIYVIHFTWEFSQISPEQFIQEVLIPLQIAGVVVGFDFRFGKGGAGTPALLKEATQGRLMVEVIDPVRHGEQKVSSSLIREKLKAGEMEEVAHFLSRPFTIKGVVIQGEKRGREIGFPTANLALAEWYLLPQNGVYGVRVDTGSGIYFGVMNIGVKPTFHSGHPLSVEVHLLDFAENLYDTTLRVEILFPIRPERKFNGIAELREQIDRDISFAKEKFLCYTM